MKTLKFNSAICTSREQSERLLALGLKKETADMMYCKTASGELITAKDDDYLEHLDSPAWSLHRLMEVYGSNYNYLCFQNAYNELIHAISISIEDGTFNKEYLEELCSKH